MTIKTKWTTIVMSGSLVALVVFLITVFWFSSEISILKRDKVEKETDVSNQLREVQLQTHINRVLTEEGQTIVKIVEVLSQRVGDNLDEGVVVDLAHTFVQQTAYYKGKGVDIPVSLMLALVEQESRFDPYAVSFQTDAYVAVKKSKGAREGYLHARKDGRLHCYGMFQFRPLTFREYAGFMDIPVNDETLIDPVIQCRMAYRYIYNAMQYYHFEKNWETMEKPIFSLHSYHWGSGNTSQIIGESGHVAARKDGVPSMKYPLEIFQKQLKYQKLGIQ